MSTAGTESIAHIFGDFELQPGQRRLLQRGRPVAIGARAFDVLTALVLRHDRMVSKSELLDIVWPGQVVEESNIQVQISALRKLIGPHAIATNPGRGYQFTALLEDSPASINRHEAATRPGGSDAAAPPSAPVGDRHNLPEPDNELIGRETDCSLLAAELQVARLVTVVGPAGIGKTRLALEVARQVVDRFADGVWWVDLGALASPDQLADAVATAAKHPLGSGDAVASLARALRGCHMLLVLDNCEHLARDIAALLRSVQEFAPRLQVLATSQVPLHMGTEHCYRIAPLEMPSEGATNEVARHAPALALLLERARAVDGRFVVEDDLLPVAASLCRELDGLPLAIELAAARLPMLGVRALHGMLHERFALLNSARADVPRRQQALQAALDWSCTLLSPDELDALQRLSIFTASFRLSNALEVIDASSAPAAVETLSSLVAKSLVQVDPREPGRYRLLESTRIYAARGLRQSGHAEATRGRWRATMARLAREREHAFWESGDDAWAGAFKSDQPDVVAAFEDCAAAGEVELAGDLGQAAQLWDYLQSIGGGVRRRVKTASTMLRAIDFRAAGDARCAGLLNVLTFFGEYQPPHPRRFQQALEHRLAAWRQRGEPWQVYRALGALAMQHAAERDSATAQRLLAEAAAMASASWPPRLLGFGAYAAAFVSMLERDVRNYRDASAAMLALCRKAGAKQEDLRARVMAVDAQVLAGEHRQAAAILETLAAEAEADGQAFGQVTCMTLLGLTHLLAGDTEGGRAIAERALPLAEEHYFSDALLGCAVMVDTRLGRCERAARLLGCCPQCHTGGSLGWSNEARACEQAQAELGTVLAPSRMAELLAEGAALERGQRLALMYQTFAPTS